MNLTGEQTQDATGGMIHSCRDLLACLTWHKSLDKISSIESRTNTIEHMVSILDVLLVRPGREKKKIMMIGLLLIDKNELGGGSLGDIVFLLLAILVAIMSDENYGTLTEWGWFPHEPCYVAALHTTTQTPSPKPPVDLTLARNLMLRTNMTQPVVRCANSLKALDGPSRNSRLNTICSSTSSVACQSSTTRTFAVTTTLKAQYSLLKKSQKSIGIPFGAYRRDSTMRIFNKSNSSAATLNGPRLSSSSLKFSTRVATSYLTNSASFTTLLMRAATSRVTGREFFELIIATSTFTLLMPTSNLLFELCQHFHLDFLHLPQSPQFVPSSNFNTSTTTQLALRLRQQPLLSSKPGRRWRRIQSNNRSASITPNGVFHFQIRMYNSHLCWVSSDRDIALRQDEATEYPEVNEQLRAEFSRRLRLIADRIGGITMKIDSVSAHLAQYRSYDAILSDFVPTHPRVSGGPEILVQATDLEGLGVVQSVSTLSDAARKVFDMAMSRLKACCDDLDEVEHEIAEFLEYLETVSIGLKTALAAEEVDVLHILRYLASEIRLSRANILTEAILTCCFSFFFLANALFNFAHQKSERCQLSIVPSLFFSLKLSLLANQA
ncbi:hypothetical protein KCU83_g650, partial [Aureobasidium melanogenum]